MATATIKPSLPLSGQRFPLYEDRRGEIIIKSIWSTEEPDENGTYTAYVLVLDDTTPELPEYGVVMLGWSDEEHFWGVLEEKRFDGVLEAAECYCDFSGDC